MVSSYYKRSQVDIFHVKDSLLKRKILWGIFALFVLYCATWVTVIFVGALKYAKAEEIRRATQLRGHVTLYIGEPLLSEGGGVIVASIPIPEDEWKALEGVNLADADPDNQKRAALREGDRLFGAPLSARFNWVELYYPEGGTFGFNFVVDPSVENPKPLVTERILVGSGGWVNWETSERHTWPDVSTIYVAGSKTEEGDARSIRMSQSRILNLGVPDLEFEGVKVITPSISQVTEGTFGDIK